MNKLVATILESHVEVSITTGGPQQGRSIDRNYVTAKALTEAGARAMEALQPPARGDLQGVGILRTFTQAELSRLAFKLREVLAETTLDDLIAALTRIREQVGGKALCYVYSDGADRPADPGVNNNGEVYL